MMNLFEFGVLIVALWLMVMVFVARLPKKEREWLKNEPYTMSNYRPWIQSGNEHDNPQKIPAKKSFVR